MKRAAKVCAVLASTPDAHSWPFDDIAASLGVTRGDIDRGWEAYELARAQLSPDGNAWSVFFSVDRYEAWALAEAMLRA